MPRASRRRRLWIALSWGVSLGLLALIAHWVPLQSVLDALSGMNPWCLAGAMGLALFNIGLRGIRWALLFRPHFEIPVAGAVRISAIGLALNAVLPGRIGEFARIELARRRFRSGFAFTATTVIADRLLDSLTLLGFLGVALSVLPEPQSSGTREIMGMTLDPGALLALFRHLAIVCLVAVLLTVAMLFGPARKLLLRGLARIRWKPIRWFEWILAEALRALDGLRHPGRLLLILALSIAIWLPLTLGNYLLAQGLPGIDLDLLRVGVITATTVALTMLPSVPGAWGVYEAGGVLTLELLQVPCEPGTALAYVLCAHAATYVPIVACGLGTMIREGLTMRQARALANETPDSSGDRSEEPPPS